MSNHETRWREPSSNADNSLQDTKQAFAKEGERAKDELSKAASEARRQGEDIASTAMKEADRYATEQKEAGAAHAASFARAVDCAADELESSSPDLARYARQAASSVDKFSETLRQSSMRELFDETNNFARREPALFFGAAVIAGMAVSRFLHSSENHEANAPHSDSVVSSPSSSTTRRYS